VAAGAKGAEGAEGAEATSVGAGPCIGVGAGLPGEEASGSPADVPGGGLRLVTV
jgi:hypothetical protein